MTGSAAGSAAGSELVSSEPASGSGSRGTPFLLLDFTAASRSAAGIAPSAAAAPLLAAGLGSSSAVAARVATSLSAPFSGLEPHMYASANAPSALVAASRTSAEGCLRLSSMDARRAERSDFGPAAGPGPRSKGCPLIARHSTKRHVAARMVSPPLPRYRRAFSTSRTRVTTRSASAPPTTPADPSPDPSPDPSGASARSASAAPTTAPCLVSSAGLSARSSSAGSAVPRVQSLSLLPTTPSARAASSRVGRSQCASFTRSRCSSSAGRYSSSAQTKSATRVNAFARAPSAK